MKIRLTCECGKGLWAQRELAGRRVKCPQCGSVLLVPNQELGDPAPPPLEDSPGRHDSSAMPGHSEKEALRTSSMGRFLRRWRLLTFVGVIAVAGGLFLWNCTFRELTIIRRPA